jgi:hypothetical protein
MWKRRDLIFIGCLFVVGILLTAFIFLPRNSKGSVVQVKVDGKIVDELPLYKNATKEIKSSHGTNTLVIENGSASITEADCKDKICVHERSIKHVGESIVCLPHRLSITIIGNADNLDIIAY